MLALNTGMLRPDGSMTPVKDLVPEDYIMDGNNNPIRVRSVTIEESRDVLIAYFLGKEMIVLEAAAETQIETDRGMVSLDRVSWKDRVHTMRGNVAGYATLGGVGISITRETCSLLLEGRQTCIGNNLILGIG